jgi:hypothetical protein
MFFFLSMGAAYAQDASSPRLWQLSHEGRERSHLSLRALQEPHDNGTLFLRRFILNDVSSEGDDAVEGVGAIADRLRCRRWMEGRD